MRLALLALFALGCGASFEQIRERELCYGQADARAQARVDAECYAQGVSFSACPARTAIMSELQLAQESCQ
jgi:hypothetical protein